MGFFDRARGKLKTPFREGASVRMQLTWKSLPEWKKNQLRRVLKDSDHDGVPDKFDCRPFNPKRQDDIDADYLAAELEKTREPGRYTPYAKGGYQHGQYYGDDYYAGMRREGISQAGAREQGRYNRENYSAQEPQRKKFLGIF